MKICTKCGQSKADEDFRAHHNACRACERAYYKAWRRRDPLDQVEVTVEVPPVEKPAEQAPPAPTPLEQATTAAKQQAEKRDLRREHSALFQETQRQAALIAELSKIQKPPEIIVYDKAQWERSDAVVCGVASDWHVEEPVESASVHGLNEYNLEIARARSEHFFKNLLRLADIFARDSRISTIWIGFLGDFFSGWIHDELVANTLLAPGDAALFVKGLLCSGIDFLLTNSSYTIEGDMLPGNHGRMTQKIQHGDPSGTSLETVMYHHVADRYRDNPRVRLQVASQAMVYRRFFETFKMRLIHGYEVNYGGGVGGLTIPLRKALAQWNNPIRADLTVLGHFHQFFDGGDFLVNGSLIGYNTYAQAIKAPFEEPRQGCFLVHARRGGQKSLTAPIWLDDVHRAR